MKSLHNLQVLAVLALAMGASTASAQTTPTPVGASTVYYNPYYFAGRVTGAVPNKNIPFLGSGTVIKQWSVLTAGHCLYGNTGWSYGIGFQRGRYNNAIIQTSAATRSYVLGGYTQNVAAYGTASAQAFHLDLGGFICSTRPANGGFAGWWANPVLLTNGSYKMSLGYGLGPTHNGNEMLRSAPTRVFTQRYGAWYQNVSYGIEGGMSGGPTFVWQNNAWYVAAVNVSGNANGNISSNGGVRALDSAASSLIKGYLP